MGRAGLADSVNSERRKEQRHVIAKGDDLSEIVEASQGEKSEWDRLSFRDTKADKGEKWSTEKARREIGKKKEEKEK